MRAHTLCEHERELVFERHVGGQVARFTMIVFVRAQCWRMCVLAWAGGDVGACVGGCGEFALPCVRALYLQTFVGPVRFVGRWLGSRMGGQKGRVVGRLW